jgi:hypothetical protein
MKRWMLVGLSLLALALVLPAVCGNEAAPPIPRPKGPPVFAPAKEGGLPTREVPLVVQVDAKAKTARLQVPFNLLFGQPGANPPGAPAVPPRGADAGRLTVPTLVAGVALTLAFASGGLWLARRRAGRSLAILLVLSLFAAGTAAVWADLGPRPLGPVRRPQPVPPALPALKLPAGVELPDKLILEAVGAGDRVTLIVPKAMVLKKDKAEAAKVKTGE